MVPVNRSERLPSNSAAKEWCANAGMAAARPTTANNPRNLVFDTRYLLLDSTISEESRRLESDQKIHLAADSGTGGNGGARRRRVRASAEDRRWPSRPERFLERHTRHRAR